VSERARGRRRTWRGGYSSADTRARTPCRDSLAAISFNVDGPSFQVLLREREAHSTSILCFALHRTDGSGFMDSERAGGWGVFWLVGFGRRGFASSAPAARTAIVMDDDIPCQPSCRLTIPQHVCTGASDGDSAGASRPMTPVTPPDPIDFRRSLATGLTVRTGRVRDQGASPWRYGNAGIGRLQQTRGPGAPNTSGGLLV